MHATAAGKQGGAHADIPPRLGQRPRTLLGLRECVPQRLRWEQRVEQRGLPRLTCPEHQMDEGTLQLLPQRIGIPTVKHSPPSRYDISFFWRFSKSFFTICQDHLCCVFWRNSTSNTTRSLVGMANDSRRRCPAWRVG